MILPLLLFEYAEDLWRLSHFSAMTADEMRTLEFSTMLAQDYGRHGRFMIFSPPSLPMSADSAFR
jgi:hypothetical protein